MLSSAPDTQIEDPAESVLLLIRIITILVFLEYVVDVFLFIFVEERNYTGIKLDNLTFLVGALLFYLSFNRFSERIDSIQFKVEPSN